MESPRFLKLSPFLFLALLAVSLVPLVQGDPSITASGQGGFDAAWSFRNPANYTLADTEIQAGQLSLAKVPGSWNSTTQGDFSNYSSIANIDLASRPGDILLNDTGYSLNGSFVSRAAGGGPALRWKSIGWTSSSVMANLSDDFAAPPLDPKWSWFNPPASYSIGTPRVGYLTFSSRVNTEFYNGQHSGQFLYQPITGDFDLQARMDTNTLSQPFQKAGLLVMVPSSPNDWYTIHRFYSGGVTCPALCLRTLTTTGGTSTTDRQLAIAAPGPEYLRIRRIGDLLEAYYSSNGTAWTYFSNASPATLPATLWVGAMVADGTSGQAVTLNVDYMHFSLAAPTPTVQLEVRTGNATDTTDPSWTPWSTPYPNPAGSPVDRSGIYLQYRILFSTSSIYLRPLVADVNISWEGLRPQGQALTEDLRPGRMMVWVLLALASDPQGGSTQILYSLDGGGNWTAVHPGPLSVTVEDRLRLQIILMSASGVPGPSVSEMRIELSPPGPPAGIFSFPWFLVLLLAFLGLGPVPPLIYYRKARVEDVFFVEGSGILIAHVSRGDTLQKDQDNLAAMFTVIQEFIADAFSYGKGQRLHRMELGEYQVAIEKGSASYLAVTHSGRGRLLISLRMRSVLRGLEARYGKFLEPWSGDMAPFKDVRRELLPLLGHGGRKSLSPAGPLGPSPPPKPPPSP